MNFFLATSPGDTITDAVNEVAKALRYPVLILALLALALVAYEIGRLGAEWFRRSQGSKERFDILARRATHIAQSGDTAGAQAILREYTYGKALQQAAVGAMFAGNQIDAQRAVVDYDIYVSRRLDRVRLLVRSGPALGLMGTLIPLAPALAALGDGDAKVLADELQTAFAITVVGVMIGLVAFCVALVRERFYTKDLADLEFLREIRGDAYIPAGATAGAAPAPALAASTQGSDVTDSPEPSSAAASQGAPTVVATPPPTMQAAPAAAATAPATPAAAPTGGKEKKKFGIKKKDKGSATPAPVVPAAAPPAAPAATEAFPPPPPAPVTPTPEPGAQAEPPTPAANDFVDPVTGESHSAPGSESNDGVDS
ncbi:MAG: MotA/TolQ/ExbB proton channel family protein [Actinobacteria bacterium]|nr:MotA/TolQ/ExbB proton channel family protein [Actinomycetota bacterium]